MAQGAEIIAESLRRCGVEDFFYLIGGPSTPITDECVRIGLRGIDTRDERAAAFAAIAYCRVTRRPGVFISGAGPGTLNTVTGVGHASVDGAFVVGIGGSSPMYQSGMDSFQETDQVSVMRPITKMAAQVNTFGRISNQLATAFSTAVAGRPGPVYVDFPADIIYGDTDQDLDDLVRSARPPSLVRASADPIAVSKAIEILAGSHRPIVIAGTGVLWSDAHAELTEFIEVTNVPLFTTPIARGLVPEDHPLCVNAARTMAFKQTDCILLVGTRANYVVNWLQAPVMSEDSRVIEVNIEPSDLSRVREADVPIAADAQKALVALTTEARQRIDPSRFSPWVEQVQDLHTGRLDAARANDALGDVPIHPLRLCIEIDAVLPDDAIVVVDGHEILGFSRQGLTARQPGHMITPGPYGTMGVGVPFGIGAKVGRPSSPVVVLTGDGAFGYHAMELDTAVRHNLGIVFVISNNGGWTGERGRPGFALDFTAYEKLSDVFGIWGAQVSEPDLISGVVVDALRYAEEEQKPAVVNVITAPVQSRGRKFVAFAHI